MLSRETVNPSTSSSFSAASVGPESAYLFRSSAVSRSRFSAAIRWFDARPRWRDTSPASPSCLYARTRRLNCRTPQPLRCLKLAQPVLRRLADQVATLPLPLAHPQNLSGHPDPQPETRQKGDILTLRGGDFPTWG